MQWASWKSCYGWCLWPSSVFTRKPFFESKTYVFPQPFVPRNQLHILNNVEPLEPLFLSCTDIDHTFDMPSRTRALEILQTEKKQYQLQLFSGVEHGFSLRGDMSNPYERKLQSVLAIFVWIISLKRADLKYVGYVKEQSLKGIIEWFDFWLSRPWITRNRPEERFVSSTKSRKYISVTYLKTTRAVMYIGFVFVERSNPSLLTLFTPPFSRCTPLKEASASKEGYLFLTSS